MPGLILLALSVAPAAFAENDNAASAAWRETLERIASGVVAIKVDATRAFDTEWNESAQATGFVVDAKRGLILTNRHVVTPGPVETDLNREVIDSIGRDKFGEWVPLGRVADVTEMVGPAIFLASDASSYVNGATLYADGGYMLNLVRYRP